MHKIKNITKYLLILLALFSSTFFITSQTSQVDALSLPVKTFALGQCGSNDPKTGKGAVKTSIDFNCNGDACITNAGAPYCHSYHNPIIDMIFSIIRLLTDGIGLIIIASLIVAGIQYTFSRGDPQAIAGATKRIQSTVTALVLFVFAYAILNYLVPNGLFGQ